jgi:hypothetical protein
MLVSGKKLKSLNRISGAEIGAARGAEEAFTAVLGAGKNQNRPGDPGWS